MLSITATTIPKLDLPLARREFLKGSGLLMGTLAAGTVLATLAPSPVWALELRMLSKADGQTLMAMGRVRVEIERDGRILDAQHRVVEHEGLRGRRWIGADAGVVLGAQLQQVHLHGCR